MSTEVKIPAVGESITSGVISTWHKKDGDTVVAGDALFTLETDKVSTEITAENGGVLRIKIAGGQEVKIGEVVALIEESSSAGAEKPAPPAPPKGSRKKAAAAAAEPGPARKEVVLPPKPSGRIQKPQEPEASPAAENLVQAQQSAGATVQIQAPEAPATPPPAAPAQDGRTTRRKLSPLRRKIAAQLVMAQQTAAILTTFNECDMTGVMDLRGRMQESFQKQYGVKLGFMSFFIKATVAALKAVPAINARLDGDDLILNHFYDIGVAVGTEKGLMVPIVRDADGKTFAEIERELGEFAGKAREGKIKIEDLQGGAFTISNGGVYGSLLSTPILNPPQSGILGMHKIQPRPIAVDGQVVIRSMMYLALSYDHRVVDGKEAVTFLVKIKELIEEPVRLLLDL